MCGDVIDGRRAAVLGGGRTFQCPPPHTTAQTPSLKLADATATVAAAAAVVALAIKTETLPPGHRDHLCKAASIGPERVPQGLGRGFAHQCST